MQRAHKIECLEDVPKEVSLLSGDIYWIKAKNAIVIQRNDGYLMNQLVITNNYSRPFKGNIVNLWETTPDNEMILNGVIINGTRYFKVKGRKNKQKKRAYDETA